MPALRPGDARRPAWLSRGSARAALIACGLSATACHPKASPTQCDELVDRYAQLVVTERFSDASAEQIKAERDREKGEARADDAFKNCSSEVSQTEFQCAMAAPSADSFEKCLE